ncbi:MAG TPA: DUF4327 domain-containing protein [Cyanobacteria bacterium UBA11369]|nr:DUF4327 domain-containing protein [Cyanobacteria bacterium UBA11371]HBE34195.1 DUF4327 domain-containing protein [Cyanobacteria bacterium UBA11368]HBE51001.1 DUF4327 domain-containing protein [Cyanobacteria bacterium UBA11369]
MSVKTVSSAVTSTSVQYTLDVIQEEARRLVHKGSVSRQQPIYTLCQFIPAREWAWVECELEKNNYLLRDRIGDLMGHEEWQND